MRGLETRVLLARARIMALVDAARANAMFLDVEYEALTQGVVDSYIDADQAPMMFAGEEERLLRWWRAGYRIGSEYMSLDVCELCGIDGYPCPIHNPPLVIED